MVGGQRWFRPQSLRLTSFRGLGVSDLGNATWGCSSNKGWLAFAALPKLIWVLGGEHLLGDSAAEKLRQVRPNLRL